MAETFNKRENEKRRQQKKKEKEQRKAERQSQEKSGSWEDMIAYVDEHGNLSSSPPEEGKKRTSIDEKDIVIGSRNIGGAEIDPIRKGKVTYYNTSKGYGFIRDLQSQESIFFHANSLTTPVSENDFVTLQVERGPKGLAATSVKKI